MIGYLQSQDRAKDRLCIGPDELTVQEFNGEVPHHLLLLGFYGVLAGQRVLFYRWKGVLRLRFGDSPPLALEGIRAEWNVVGGQAKFALTRGNETVVEHTYPVSVDLLTIDEDPTAFAEAEDFDLLLFVSNVLSDSDRSERIFRGAEG